MYPAWQPPAVPVISTLVFMYPAWQLAPCCPSDFQTGIGVPSLTWCTQPDLVYPAWLGVPSLTASSLLSQWFPNWYWCTQPDLVYPAWLGAPSLTASSLLSQWFPNWYWCTQPDLVYPAWLGVPSLTAGCLLYQWFPNWYWCTQPDLVYPAWKLAAYCTSDFQTGIGVPSLTWCTQPDSWLPAVPVISKLVLVYPPWQVPGVSVLVYPPWQVPGVSGIGVPTLTDAWCQWYWCTHPDMPGVLGAWCQCSSVPTWQVPGVSVPTLTGARCQCTCVAGSLPGLLNSVSVLYNSLKWQVWSIGSISVWSHTPVLHTPVPKMNLACCGDVQQPRNKTKHLESHWYVQGGVGQFMLPFGGQKVLGTAKMVTKHACCGSRRLLVYPVVSASSVGQEGHWYIQWCLLPLWGRKVTGTSKVVSASSVGQEGHWYI